MSTINPRVYVGTYAKYNDGSLFGRWFDLDDYTDLDSFLEDAYSLHSDEHDPELMFQDWETDGAPDEYFSESSISPDLWQWIETVESSLYDPEVFAAAAYFDIPADEVEDRYQGEYSSREDFAAEMVESTGLLDQVPENIRCYFDYDAFGRDLLLDGYSEHNDHYFYTY